MKKLVVVVALLGALGVGGEIAAASYAEGRIEQQVSESARELAGVSADIQSFPMVTRILATGEVQRVVLTLDEVGGNQVAFATVRLEMRGLDVDRQALAAGRFRARDVESATITAEIRSEGLARFLTPVVNLTPDGSITVSASRGSLQIGGLRIPTAMVPLPTDVLPCDPTAEIQSEAIVVWCTVSEIPPFLVQALQRGS